MLSCGYVAPVCLLPRLLADTICSECESMEYPAQKRPDLERGMCNLFRRVWTNTGWLRVPFPTISLDIRAVSNAYLIRSSIESDKSTTSPPDSPLFRIESGCNHKRKSPSQWSPPQNCDLNVRLFHSAFESFTRRYYGTENLANEEAAVRNFLVCSAA
ncbi:hypothetical protein BDM02DRAFT_1314444 [Thelephora ganbajun]|uniref:Uncharacterized protein n=1 Tax=Thelephora ganbajun TaxID=370292 RepID=A0ACB6Z3V8_THEGA|nr:hypothetical protein BDM02DRAFT_1314444 [Thelephora ganbajun]